jgi:hypothetical protein
VFSRVRQPCDKGSSPSLNFGRLITIIQRLGLDPPVVVIGGGGDDIIVIGWVLSYME